MKAAPGTEQRPDVTEDSKSISVYLFKLITESCLNVYIIFVRMNEAHAFVRLFSKSERYTRVNTV